MSNGRGHATNEACASIVHHYSDPIHQVRPLGDSDADDDIQQSNVNHANTNGKSAPYYDPNLGQPMPDLSPVCGFWYRRLLEASGVSDDDGSLLSAENRNAPLLDSAKDSAKELLCCYESSIHPCVKRKKKSTRHGIHDDGNKIEREFPFSAMVDILSNYELLLAHFMRDIKTTSDSEEISVEGKCSNLMEVISGIDENITCEPHDEILGRVDDTKLVNELTSPGLDICKMIRVISDDIFQWSIKLPKKDDEDLWKVQNILLPYLLRLLEHAVVLLALHTQGIGNSTFKTQLQEGLAISTVAAISFVGDGRLNSGVFGVGSLLDWIFERTNEDGHESSSMPSILSLAQTVQSCHLFTISKTEDPNGLPEPIMSSNFMTRSVVDWSDPSAHFEASWTDGVTGVGSRVAMSLLQQIYESSCCDALLFSMGKVEVKHCSGNRTHYLRTLLRKISQNIGANLLASTVRAHFYGRLPHTCSSDANMTVQSQASGVFMPMVKRIGSNHHMRAGLLAASSYGKPHIEIPMRLSAASIILCAVLLQPCNNFKIWDEALSDAVPIAMSLLDDVQPIHQSIGALLFVSVIEAASSSAFEGIPSFVVNFRSVVSSSLENSIQICGRESPTLFAVICLAQSKWIRYLGIYSQKQDTTMSSLEVHSMARKAAADILVSIRKQVQTGGRDSNDDRIAGALVAGINPLLNQLASFPEAASVEITRIGLSALLPLIGWSGMRLEVRSAQISALVGLVSLMSGAYPIMPHHGKKIMTEVFLLLDRADKDIAYLSNSKMADSIGGKNLDDEISTDATIKVVLYAASVTLTICGTSARDVVDHIESTQLSRKHLLNRCIEIRATSKQLRSNIN